MHHRINLARTQDILDQCLVARIALNQLGRPATRGTNRLRVPCGQIV